MRKIALKLRSNSLQRDLIRLGVLPCATAAVALTLWFTHERVMTLEQAFHESGTAIVRQLAAASDLSVYAGDTATLRDLADNTVAKGIAARVEIGNGADLYAYAGQVPEHARLFEAPVRLRTMGGMTGPSDGQASSDAIGTVRVFLDDMVLRHTRTTSILVGAGIGGLALLLAWLSARHMARAVARPLRQISSTVAALREGKLDARCGLGGHNEIAALAADVDKMAQRLQDAYQLQEDRIRAATREALTRMTQAEQATQSRTRFLATASHDLRQPVHAMGLFIDGLLPTATAAQLPSIRRLQEGTQVMSSLLDALLDISRLDANVLLPIFAPTPLRDLFGQLDVLHAAVARESGVTLIWHHADQTVMTDAGLLMRILDNLVRNAVRHARDRVLIAARRSAGGVRIEVRDGGVGIEPVHQARIFEEFYQIGNAQRDRHNGFGLGLSICARIAALLGTEIHVRSALNRGCTFSLELPVTNAVAERVPSAGSSQLNESLLDACCLLVDDDEAILEGTGNLLRQWGCSVDWARSSDEALRHLSGDGNCYDLILCDMQLGGHEDGLFLLHRARDLQPEATFILISGTTTPDMLRQVRAASITLLTKPVAPAKLRALAGTLRKPGRRHVRT